MYETDLTNDAIFGLGGLINEIGIAIPKLEGLFDLFRDDDDREAVIQGATPQPTQILPPAPNWVGATKDYVSQVNIPLITVGVALLGVVVVVWLFDVIRGK